jgi:hypothetical protein
MINKCFQKAQIKIHIGQAKQNQVVEHRLENGW